MVTNRLAFDALGRNINLELNRRITIIGGDSGTGKTLIFKVIEKMQNPNIITISSNRLNISGRTFKQLVRREKRRK